MKPIDAGRPDDYSWDCVVPPNEIENSQVETPKHSLEAEKFLFPCGVVVAIVGSMVAPAFLVSLGLIMVTGAACSWMYHRNTLAQGTYDGPFISRAALEKNDEQRALWARVCVATAMLSRDSESGVVADFTGGRMRWWLNGALWDAALLLEAGDREAEVRALAEELEASVKLSQSIRSQQQIPMEWESRPMIRTSGDPVGSLHEALTALHSGFTEVERHRRLD